MMGIATMVTDKPKLRSPSSSPSPLQPLPQSSSSSSFSTIRGGQYPCVSGNSRSNPKSPSSKVCVSCFFELFNRKKESTSKKSRDNKDRVQPEVTNSKSPKVSSQQQQNLTRNHYHHHQPLHSPFTADVDIISDNDKQLLDVSSGFTHKLSPTKRKELKKQQLDSSHEQQQPIAKRRSRLTLNLSNNHLLYNNFPVIEYVQYEQEGATDYNNHTDVTTTATAGDVVHTSTPRYDRDAVASKKTGKVVERMWVQRAPPVARAGGFDPTAEAKLFEAHEGIFVVDPNSGRKYRKGRFLGKGGFANCFEFTDVSTNAVYAGKVICKSHFQKPKQKEKMMLEIKLHRQLEHDNVVAFHDYFEDHDNLYMMLELCSRKSLDDLLKSRGALTEPEVRYFMRQLVDGCRYIHSMRIIHRDLKLGNLLLNGSMQVKIADFGLATQVSYQDVRKKSICGTPNYVAPEVIRRRFYSFEVDVWSIGCIMYTLLCGVTPFETTTLRATYDRISTATYTLPSYLSAPSRDLIVRLLDLNPVDRLSLDQVLYEEFFTSGLAPAHLSPSVCFRRPNFPKSNCLTRAHSMSASSKGKRQTTIRQQQQQQPQQNQQLRQQQQQQQKLPTIRKVFTTNVIAGSSHFDLSTVDAKHEDDSPGNYKNGALPKAKKVISTISLYKILGRCMGSFQKDTATELEILDSRIMYVTRWVDFSNKYGFGFQMSDDSTGILFNDTTRMTLRQDSVTLKYVDWSNVISTWKLPADDNMTEDCKSKLSVLMYVKVYMYKRLKPTRLDSSQSTVSSVSTATTTEEVTTDLSTNSSGVQSLRSSWTEGNSVTDQCSVFAGAESSHSSSEGSTAGGDSREEFSGSVDADSSVSGSAAIFTLGTPETNFLSTLSASNPRPSSPERSPLSRKTSTSLPRRETNVDTKPLKRTQGNAQMIQRGSEKIRRMTKKRQSENSCSVRRFSSRATSSKTGLNPDGEVSGSLNSASSTSTLDSSSRTIVDDVAAETGGIFVTKWFREDDVIIMQLSNGTYQVNFLQDHSKIILSLHDMEYVVTHIPDVNSNASASRDPTPQKPKVVQTSKKIADGQRGSKNSRNDNNSNNQKPVHHRLFEICEKGCSPSLAQKLRIVRRKLYKLINFEGELV